jgi:hypothetical protein
LLAIGLVLVPPAIYVVGQRLVGPYATDSGVLALAEDIWKDFLTLRPAAWMLILSPYFIAQIVRVARRVWRPKSV